MKVGRLLFGRKGKETLLCGDEESVQTLEPVICADVENRNVPNKPVMWLGRFLGRVPQMLHGL